MTGVNSSRSVVAQLLENYCAARGLRLTLGDPHGHAGHVENRAGKRWFFKGTRFDLNPYGAAEVANDKAYTCRFLSEAGIAVPKSHFVPAKDIRTGKRPPEDVLDFAEDTGFPLYVKPNEGQEGIGVMRVDTYHTLQNALHILAKSHEAMLVQEEIRGTDLRILVLDGEVLCAFERHAPEVTGDGTSSLAELVDAHPSIDPGDGRIDFELSQQALMLESVPEAGRTVSLLPVSNLSSGGTAKIITAALAPELHAMARQAVKTLGLRYAGVDLIVPFVQRPDTKAVVLEVNAAPGLANLYRRGWEETAAVKQVYEKVFEATFGE
ncbi:ATP-dependent carboxylate-amine ligase [Roseibium sediminicola]|uniref:ATP-dependent carboxylate-amine ligase n=1 Tax=Roseibium sediminicola TaxID=2933272 RepID=A0ABT0GYK4_9HYPH|nr:ATP-dependent carboxylate-amine ligase [Roseibium sp. CAU 1639]MCK7614411.1 ATP-dependent carboxylate-amine ligase [Roseibium sp. CAU 1639]